MGGDKKQTNKKHSKASGIKSPLPRKVHLGKDVWTYTVGKADYDSGSSQNQVGARAVIIRSPDGQHTKPFKMSEVVVYNPQVSNTCPNCNGSGQISVKDKAITPGTVKEFLMDRFGGSITGFKNADK